MDASSASIALLIAAALIGANLPFLIERIFFLVPLHGARKAFGWRLLEWFCMYLVVGLLARAIEGTTSPVYAQRWEFYAITICLFLVLAYPGFVYRYLWRHR
ncbi:MAG: DUF2818 family protein [Burkholderiales bacterium]